MQTDTCQGCCPGADNYLYNLFPLSTLLFFSSSAPPTSSKVCQDLSSYDFLDVTICFLFHCTKDLHARLKIFLNQASP